MRSLPLDTAISPMTASNIGVQKMLMTQADIFQEPLKTNLLSKAVGNRITRNVEAPAIARIA
jgi:hypothetical protein